jgi:hypothetical protein
MLDPTFFTPNIVQRFEGKLVPGPGDCWTWQGNRDRDGYGRFKVRGTEWRAHRWSYTYHVSDIPDGLQLDHLCRNRSCVNPHHLDPVTNKVNILRGETVTGALAAAMSCPNGHEYTEENTIRLFRATEQRWSRRCRECKVANNRREDVQRKIKRRGEAG